jgi:hypothetical protein
MIQALDGGEEAATADEEGDWAGVSAAMRRRRLTNAVSISSSKRGNGQSGVSWRAMNT